MSTETQRQLAKAGRFYLLSEIRFVVRLWLVFVALVALFVGVRHWLGFEMIDSSVWEQATQVMRWFVGVWGIYQPAVYLPILIAHGYTRGEFCRLVLVVAALYGAAVAALATFGFAIESAVYFLAGWTQSLDNTYHLLFSAPTQYLQIFVHYTLTFFVWLTIGAAIGAAFYRFRQLAIPIAAVALFVLANIEAILTWSRPLVIKPGSSLPLSLGIAIYAVVVLVALAGTWWTIRDMPMRTKHN